MVKTLEARLCRCIAFLRVRVVQRELKMALECVKSKINVIATKMDHSYPMGQSNIKHT